MSARYTTAATLPGDNGAGYSVRTCTGAQSLNNCVLSQTATLGVQALALNATALAGTPGVTGSSDGSGAAVRFSTPNYLAANAAGTVYIGDFSNHTLRDIGIDEGAAGDA